MTMNFVELINESQVNLISDCYLNHLFSKISNKPTATSSTLDDREVYRNHLPLDMKKFLRQAICKLREMRDVNDEDTWAILNEKYIMSLVYFVLEEEDTNLDNALYASNIFVLLNVIPIPDKRLFYKVTYLKILEVLNTFNNLGDFADETVISLMDDFKRMLTSISLPDETIISTIAVLHGFTYSCNEQLQQIDTDISSENLGYIAFVSLKILAEKLVQQKKDKNLLYPIILSMMSSLKSTTITNFTESATMTHQKNVILFIKENCSIFRFEEVCLITDALKTVCLVSEYDNYQGIAELIRQLPVEINKDFFQFFVKTMLCTRDEFKKNCLDLVVPLLRNPADDETIAKRLVKAEIILTNVVTLFADKNDDVRTRALKIVAEYSEDTLGRRVLRKMMGPNNFGDVNKDTIQDMLYHIVDPSWNKKKLNVSYIQFICNLFTIRKDLVTVKALNRLRTVCLKGSPFDLKPCITNLKGLLENHSRDQDVIMYTLSIFAKQMLHPMSTSVLFAKELGDIIFSNITVNEGENFIWNVIDHLVSHNFPVYAIFEKFHLQQMLQDRYIRLLMEYKIQESNCRKPALKLLCIMLNFAWYSKSHLLEEMLEDWIITQLPQLQNPHRRQLNRNGTRINLSPSDLSLVIYALSKIMERKRKSDCNHTELQNYRQLQHLVCQAFFEQTFPVAAVHHVTNLLSVYANLMNEDVYWDSSACASFEEELRSKLNHVCNTNLDNQIYLSRDVVYIGELVLTKKASLNTDTFNLLKRIATASEHSRNLSDYLKNNDEVWSSCLTLYVKACFVNKPLIEDCVENLGYILTNGLLTHYSKLQMLYALHDICSVHFEYYDPLVPFLFNALNEENDYLRFIASKIIIKLVQEEHLRLMDGQYYIFMSLLADKNAIISQNVELFVRDHFVKKYPQTIAACFIPSIVHYNFCYTYPGISLLVADRELLKLKRNMLVDRRNIYSCLLDYLPNNIKFNMLHQISGEILLKFLEKKLKNIPEALNLFEDALSIIALIVPKEKINRILDVSSYFDDEVNHITALLSSAESSTKPTETKAEQTALRSLCFYLLQILYSIKNPKGCQNVFFIISLITKNFETMIKQIIHDDSKIKDLFLSLKKFYHKNKSLFQNRVLTVDQQFSSFLEDDSVEFYWRELADFTFIHPCKIVGDSNN